MVRPAGRVYLEVEVLHSPGKGKLAEWPGCRSGKNKPMNRPPHEPQASAIALSDCAQRLHCLIA